MGFSKQPIVVLGLALMATQAAMAYDPTITTDFGLPTPVTGANFTSTRFEASQLPAPNGMLQFVPNVIANFPGLSGLGISSAFFIVGPGKEVPPHTHPRATELFYVISGTWTVGFLDTNSTPNLYTSDLGPGDQFVFPIGLLHFQIVTGNDSATGFSAFNSENPGVALTATTLFASNPLVPTDVLAGAFMISDQEVYTIEQALG